MRPRESWLLLSLSAMAACAVAALFYIPALTATGGDWPAPLDDVFIHFDFARSLARGSPFEWIPGQGYASGETSPAYAVVLAAGYLVGFHGLALGVWGALVAGGCLVYAAHALREAVRPAPAWVAGLGVGMLLSCGTLGFAWWSGMEVALFGAVAAGLLVRVKRARDASPVARRRAQWSVGAWGALLILVRPESAVIVGVAMVVVARQARASSAIVACARCGAPGAAVTLIVLGLNYVGTGHAASAGALLKLLSSNPFATDVDRARDFVVNLIAFATRARHDLGAAHGHFAFLLPALGLVSLTSRRTRGLGLLCLGGAVVFALLVSWNGTARYQNFRYYMPAVTLWLFASTLGVAALSSSRRGRIVGAAAAAFGIVVAALHVTESTRLFARASRNIHDQQVEVGRRLTHAPESAILLVGDAGAIPYVSERHAIDAFGLGGYMGLPFVTAAVQGEAATVELIERLPPQKRPTIMALYPNWFPAITATFGHETDHVTITDNVICGGVTKGIYLADWSTLEDPGAAHAGRHPALAGLIVDELDVADVVSEAAHAYVSPAPHGGFTVLDIRETAGGIRRFDAGRVIPAGEAESFVVRAGAAAGGELVVRTDGGASEVTVTWRRHGRPLGTTARLEPAFTKDALHWGVSRSTLAAAVAPGDRATLTVTSGELRDFHLWLAAPPSPPLSAHP